MDSGSDESATSLELASDIMDLLSDDIMSPVRTELDADVEYEGACWSEEGELDADVEHEGACWSDEDELEFDISTDEESDLETDGADQLPFESQPSDSSLPMASENEDWKQPLYPGAKLTKIDSFLLLVQFMLRWVCELQVYKSFVLPLQSFLATTKTRSPSIACRRIPSRMYNSVLFTM